MTTAPNAVTERLWKALDERHDELVQLVADLVRFRSVLGHEAEIQEFIANYLRENGMETDVWEIDESLKELDESGDSGVPFAGRPNVAATMKGSSGWRSLIMNGHIDVVSPEPLADWTYDPWAAEIVDGRMYGRGALDMKSGVAINMFLPRVLRDLGITLKGDLIVQSVIEEECTGNGAFDASRRYTADAVVVTEPSGGEFTNAHVGVMWFRILVSGRSAHAARATTGVNAISKTVPIIQALEALDAKMNETTHPAFEGFDHPINLNIGVIRGGDWPSSVAGDCTIECRLSMYPGVTVEDTRARVHAAIEHAVERDEWLSQHPPTVEWYGFQSPGSVVEPGEPILETLARHHLALRGGELAPRSLAGTTDMRNFNIYAGIPVFCYGPGGSGAHAADEWLDLDSLVPTAKVIGATILEWCGVHIA